MLQQPKVGDIILMKARVVSVDKGGNGCLTFKPEFLECEIPGTFSRHMNAGRIHQILERPLQVGDTVYTEGSTFPHTLLCIQEDPANPIQRKWGVIAYKTDIPKVVPFHELRGNA